MAWGPNGQSPGAPWLEEHALRPSSVDFLAGLEGRAPDGSVLRRSLAAIRSFAAQLDGEGKDAGVVEAHAFISALAGHGLSEQETAEHRRDLLGLQEAVVLARSFQLYQRAEGLVALAGELGDTDPQVGLDFLEKAAAIYKRLAEKRTVVDPTMALNEWLWRPAEVPLASVEPGAAINLLLELSPPPGGSWLTGHCRCGVHAIPPSHPRCITGAPFANASSTAIGPALPCAAPPAPRSASARKCLACRRRASLPGRAR